MKSKFYHTLHIEKTKRSDDKKKRENQLNNYDAAELEVIEKVNAAYREYLDAGKTERECAPKIFIPFSKGSSPSWNNTIDFPMHWL